MTIEIQLFLSFLFIFVSALSLALGWVLGYHKGMDKMYNYLTGTHNGRDEDL